MPDRSKVVRRLPGMRVPQAYERSHPSLVCVGGSLGRSQVGRLGAISRANVEGDRVIVAIYRAHLLSLHEFMLKYEPAELGLRISAALIFGVLNDYIDQIVLQLDVSTAWRSRV